ncbi:hypothetical protein HanRHA438_Chr06g0269961 [Helianthus annuus]|nr:hypothetical protein HanHA300_Chr06g0213911 [Helianthus annuus]KAJ0573702.1 hypothetical protein HanHA89_Chr06g0229681 [Helianthus annuus]KAJ0740930.1 hypothetical protein HanOQP8_Chr06g0222221 [Helianthus annuus]KAJ0912052.1 hypothetical protein HanRHA438_Chr06g0269961 [Helianthus annuus]
MSFFLYIYSLYLDDNIINIYNQGHCCHRQSIEYLQEHIGPNNIKCDPIIKPSTNRLWLPVQTSLTRKTLGNVVVPASTSQAPA